MTSPNAGSIPSDGTAISATALADQHAQHQIVVIDVREAMEYASGHIAGSLNVPLRQLPGAVLPERPLVLVCQSGQRSSQGLRQLLERDHRAPLRELAGGLMAWEQAGLPLRRLSKAPLPLMRQVQIAAGSLVLLGLTLGTFVAPGWLLLSWVVGAGLVFAGISGFCGMARLLALLPWNRITQR